MEKFNIHRFGLVLRQNVMHQSRNLFMTSLGCVLLHLAAQSFSFFQYINSASPDPASTERMAMEQSSVFFLFISVFFMFWCIALSCYHLKDKPGCITALMLPATVQEKFAARLFIFTVGAFVVNLLAIVAADLLRILLFSLQPNHFGTALPAFVDFCGRAWSQFWHDVDEGDLHYGGGICMFLHVAKSLWFYTIFLLGAVVFRRRAFVITVCILVALSAATALLLSGHHMAYAHETNEWSAVVLSIFFYLLCAAVFVWMSYALFKRTTLVRRKWF